MMALADESCKTRVPSLFVVAGKGLCLFTNSRMSMLMLCLAGGGDGKAISGTMGCLKEECWSVYNFINIVSQSMC